MDYKKAEEEGLKRLEKVCADAAAVQERLLTELLERNSQTEYGRKYKFSDIKTVQDYQTIVPVTKYSAYEELIERQINGENNLITSDPAAYYCISSGSEDKPKYVPITQRDIDIMKIYLLDVVMGTIREGMKDVPEKELFGKIFEVGEFYRTFMENGTMNGVRSGAFYRWLEAEGEMDFSWFTAPMEVFFPEKLEDMLYVKLRFALACRELTMIEGIFVHRLVRTLRFLVQNWEAFLSDIETGGVSECFRVSEEWKDYLTRNLLPDAGRAEELRAIPIHDSDCRIARRIWPELKVVCIVGGSIFESYMKELYKFIGDLPIHYNAYAASETSLGVACGIDQADARYVLIPEASFFEFVPEQDESCRPLTFQEVQVGQKYELLITTLSGLYRYAIGDVVEVVDFHGEAPVIRICYRKYHVMNLYDENMNMSQLQNAMQKYERLTGCLLEGYCVDDDPGAMMPSYLVYLETDEAKMPDTAALLMDRCLKESCLGYKNAREMRQIGDVKIALLNRGSFQAYDAFLAGKGYRTEQNKPPVILTTSEQKEFFKNAVYKYI